MKLRFVVPEMWGVMAEHARDLGIVEISDEQKDSQKEKAQSDEGGEAPHGDR